MTVTCEDVCKIFWAIFLPPIAVAMEKGCCTCAVLLNICLTILGWLPGQIHAFCVILHCTEDKENANAPAQTQAAPAPAQPAPAQPAPAPAPAAQPAPAPAAQSAPAPAQPAPAQPAASTTVTTPAPKA